MRRAAFARALTPALAREQARGMGAMRMRALGGCGCSMGSIGAMVSADAALSLLPPDVQQGITQLQSQVSDASPMIALASTVSGGGAPSPAQVTAALAAAATLVTGNPLAGAAMAAAGGLVQGLSAGLQGLFSALGLYSATPMYSYVGLRRTTDVVPSGQLDPDWWFVRTGGGPNLAGDLYRIQQGKTPPGTISHPPVSGNYNGTALNFFHTLLAYYDYAAAKHLPVGTVSATTRTMNGRAVADSGTGYFVANLSPFERFVLPMLRQTMENWANGTGFVRPRDVLQQAAIVWNAQHTSATTQTFQPIDGGALNGSAFFVADLLGGYGDLALETTSSGTSRLPPLTINMGPEVVKHIAFTLPKPAPKHIAFSTAHLTASTAAGAKAPAPAMSAGSKVAAAAAGAGGAALLWWLGSHGWKWVTPRWARRLVR